MQQSQSKCVCVFNLHGGRCAVKTNNSRFNIPSAISVVTQKHKSLLTSFIYNVASVVGGTIETRTHQYRVIGNGIMTSTRHFHFITNSRWLSFCFRLTEKCIKITIEAIFCCVMRPCWLIFNVSIHVIFIYFSI